MTDINPNPIELNTTPQLNVESEKFQNQQIVPNADPGESQLKSVDNKDADVNQVQLIVVQVIPPDQNPNSGSSSPVIVSSLAASPNTAFQIARDRFATPATTFKPKTKTKGHRPVPRPREIKFPIRFNIDEPHPAFSGRLEFLKEFDESIKKNLSSSSFPQIHLNGASGSGKTQLVKKYIQIYGHNYENIIWIDGQSKLSLENSFRDLAHSKLHLNLKTIQDQPTQLSLLIQKVYETLCQVMTLFIFDNISDSLALIDPEHDDDHDDNFLKPFLPTSIQFPSHLKRPLSVFITNNLDLNPDPSHIDLDLMSNVGILKLDVFTLNESIHFMKEQLNIEQSQSSNKVLSDLIEKLGRLPLTLTLAMAYIKQQKFEKNLNIPFTTSETELENYAAKFKIEDEKTALLAWPSMTLNSCSFERICQVTWKITWQKIRQEINPFGESVLKLVEILAFLNSTKIPFELISALTQDDDGELNSNFENQNLNQSQQNSIELTKSLELLGKYSIVHLHHFENSNGENLYSHITLHSQVRDAILAKLKDDSRTSSILHLVIEKSLNFLRSMDLENSENFEDGVTSIRDSLISILSIHEQSNGSPLFFEFQTELSINLSKFGLHDEAWRTIKILHDSHKFILDNDECVENQKLYSKILCIMAKVLKGLQKYDESLLVCTELLSLNKSLYDSTDQSILTTQSEIGFLLNRLGRYEDALKIYEGLYRAKSTHLGPDHPSALTTHHYKALALQNLGRNEEALKIYENVRATRDRIGSCDANNLLTLNNMALILDKLGRYDEAISLYQEMIQMEEKLFGPSSVKTFKTRNNIALTYYHKGDYEKSILIYQTVFEIEQKIFGFHHPLTFDTCVNIGDILFEQGRYMEAQEIYRKVYDSQKTHPGEKHPVTLMTKCKLAKIKGKQGHFNEAAIMFGEVYDQQMAILGSSHPSTLTTQSLLASVIGKLGCQEDSYKILKHVFQSQRDLLGSDHLETLQTLNNMAIILDQLGRLEEAEECYSNVFEILLQKLGFEHPSTLAVQSNLARVLDQQGKFEDALRIYQNVLKGLEKSLSGNHPNVLNTKHNMALTMRDLGRLEDAAGVLQGVYDVMKVILGQDHPSTLNTLDCLADVRRKEGRRKEAMDIFQIVYQRKIEVLGENHPDTRITVMSIESIQREEEEEDGRIEKEIFMEFELASETVC